MVTDSSLLLDLALTAPITCSLTDWDACYVIEPHYHNNDQLIYAANGVISVETADGFWVVPTTRGVWVPAKVIHSVHIPGPVRLITLQFSSKLSPISGEKCRVINVPPLLREAMLRFMSITDAYTRDGPEARLAAVMLDEIQAAQNIAPLHLPMPTDSRARKIALEFRKNPSLRLSLKDWSTQGGASERTIARLFNSETGMSFGQWQRQARLLRALEILGNGESVIVAALEVGFSSASAFIAMFRNSMGCTPTQYFQLSPWTDDKVKR